MEIVKEEMLVKVSATYNNNKFYHVILFNNGQVHKKWGRVGTDGTTTTSSGGERAYEQVLREKKRKGYKPVDLADSSSSPSRNNDNLVEVARTALVGKEYRGNAIIESLVEKLVAQNRHDILETSGGLIDLDTSGVIKTPLGIISLNTIQKAEVLLEKAGASSKPSISLIEDYLTLVPQKVPARYGWQDAFFADDAAVQKQADFLKQLKESYAWHEEQQKLALDTTRNSPGAEDLEEKYKSLFKLKIGLVEDGGQEFQDAVTMFKSSINRRHATSNKRVKRVYSLTDPDGDAVYNRALETLGNQRRLWHGTKAFNVLSILRKGLFVPPRTGRNIPIAGRMFGDGVYFSDQSTKSLNYSYGIAPGQSRDVRDRSSFMFIADVVMGNEFRPNMLGYSQWTNPVLNRSRNGVDANGRPFNSTSIRGGTCGVLNNEMIVWNTDQIALRYLVEFE
jgi:poly [ADP-ribose] polymerase 2/3/4